MLQENARKPRTTTEEVSIKAPIKWKAYSRARGRVSGLVEVNIGRAGVKQMGDISSKHSSRYTYTN